MSGRAAVGVGTRLWNGTCRLFGFPLTHPGYTGAGTIALGAAGTGIYYSHGTNNAQYIPWVIQEAQEAQNFVICTQHPSMNGRPVAYQPVRNSDGSLRVNEQGLVMVHLFDARSTSRVQLDGQAVPSIFNREDFEAALREAPVKRAELRAAVMSMGAAGRATTDALGLGTEIFQTASAPTLPARGAVTTPPSSARSPIWDAIKPFLPFAGPALGLGIAAMGNFSIGTLLVGGAIAAGGIFADRIESGIAEQRRIREAAEAATAGGAAAAAGASPTPAAGARVDAPAPAPTARDVASQIDMPQATRLPSAEAAMPSGSQTTPPAPAQQTQTPAVST